MIGRSIAHYEILERIGSGGMGEVYRARDTRIGREVALKILPPEMAADPVRLERFRLEARNVSTLSHPNILTLHDVGDSQAGPYIVTELIQGQTLRQLSSRTIGAHGITNLILQAAEGLAKAHAAGVVHRDIKPDNLMLTDDGFVKILDFGLARLQSEHDDSKEKPTVLTQTGTVVGTAAYLAPERVFGAAGDARSDVFSLGVVWYELLYREHPFLRETLEETLKAIAQDDALPKPDSDLIASGLLQILQKTMAKDPEQRFANGRELAEALRPWTSAPVREAITPARPRTGWAWKLALTGLVVALIGATLWSVLSSGKRPTDATTLPRQVSALPAGKLAVAVLPATNHTRDPRLADADIERILGDVLVHILSDVRDLYVVSPILLDNTARQLGREWSAARQNLDFARRVCELAQAEAIVSVDLSKVGSTYALTAAMTNIRDQELVGSFRAESQSSDRLLPELSQRMRDVIEKRFTAGEHGDAVHERVATRSVEAYAHFVRGLDFVNEARWSDAIPELEQALDIDPGMGMAWSELGCAFSFSGDQARAEASQWEAEKWVEQLTRREKLWIELNGIWLRTYNGKLYREKLEEFLQEFPDDRNGYFYGGLAAEWLDGNCPQALVWYEKAYTLTPFYYPITKSLVDCFLKTEKTAEAIAALERYLQHPMVPQYGRRQAVSRLEELRRGS